jgi:EAL domain-containing protein (putative c-di-GMP-specific phosphodiesterase class I)
MPQLTMLLARLISAREVVASDQAPLAGDAGIGNPEAADGTRDRHMFGAAFTQADILVETTLDGHVVNATGAFPKHFGHGWGRFRDHHITSLIAPGSHAAVLVAIAAIHWHGGIPPMPVLLVTPGRTRASLAAILLSGPRARLYFMIGPDFMMGPNFMMGPDCMIGADCMIGPDAVMASGCPAAVAGATQDADDPPLDLPTGPSQFLREAEALVRGGADCALEVVELVKMPSRGLDIDAPAIRAVHDQVLRVLRASGTVTAELSDGRFGMLRSPHMDLGRCLASVRQVLDANPAGRNTGLAEWSVPMTAGALRPAQIVGAMRYVVRRFAEGGVAAARELGGAGGIADVVAKAEIRCRATRRILADGHFELKFQPIVALTDQRLHHYEALLRPSPRADCPVHSIQDFVAFAESVELSEELDLAVLGRALGALGACPDVSIAVNMSGLSVQSPAFRTRVVELISGSPAMADRSTSSARLLVELTETAEIENLAEASRCIAALHELGVPLCIDDFGSGAALGYLNRFKAEYVKIDGAYIRIATKGARERRFVASIIDLARSTGAQIVAEMVETEQQASLMRDMGVTLGQGWLFGRPGHLPGMVGHGG